MRLRDRAFQQVFREMFVYNILFEDAEQDERYLGIDERSAILSITGAGCGVATMMSKNPRSLDAVDINAHHLALSGLKITAARHLRSYDDFYALLARGSHENPKDIIGSVAHAMPTWMTKYWSRHHSRFRKSLYWEGLTSQMLRVLRKLTGCDAQWLLSVAALDPAARMKAVDDVLAPVLNMLPIRLMMESPVQLLALGVNYEQKDKMLKADRAEDLKTFFVNHMKRVAGQTDLYTNWFAWHAIAGHFNHDRQDSLPPYLRKDRHDASTQSDTQVRFFNGNLFDRLDAASNDTWSHYTLCDAPDWMNDSIQKKLLDEIYRTSRDGAVVLTRSVEHDSFIDRIDGGRRFQLITDASAAATAADRTRQYRRVDFHRVCHAA